MAKRIDVSGMSAFYGGFRAVDDISMTVEPRTVTAFIGPSGCGKSTVLRSLNRMHEVIPGAHVEGKVLLDDVDLYGSGVDPVAVRRTVGMVFQRPNPFPTMSIYDNVAAGLRLNGMKHKGDIENLVENSLRGANLWDEVKDRLKQARARACLAVSSSGCASRARSRSSPQVLLMDEPCSALDPISTLAIEDLIAQLKTRVHDRHRHAQHAAGRPRQRPHGVLQHRRHRQARQADRDRPTSRIFANPTDSAPRTTSPAASDDQPCRCAPSR